MKAGSFGLTQLLCFFTMQYNTDLILKDSVTVCGCQCVYGCQGVCGCQSICVLACICVVVRV